MIFCFPPFQKNSNRPFIFDLHLQHESPIDPLNLRHYHYLLTCSTIRITSWKTVIVRNKVIIGYKVIISNSIYVKTFGGCKKGLWYVFSSLVKSLQVHNLFLVYRCLAVAADKTRVESVSYYTMF